MNYVSLGNVTQRGPCSQMATEDRLVDLETRAPVEWQNVTRGIALIWLTATNRHGWKTHKAIMSALQWLRATKVSEEGRWYSTSCAPLEPWPPLIRSFVSIGTRQNSLFSKSNWVEPVEWIPTQLRNQLAPQNQPPSEANRFSHSTSGLLALTGNLITKNGHFKNGHLASSARCDRQSHGESAASMVEFLSECALFHGYHLPGQLAARLPANKCPLVVAAICTKPGQSRAKDPALL